MQVNHFRARRRAMLMGAGASVLTLLPYAAARAQDVQPTVYSSAMRYDGAGRLVGEIAPDPDGAGPLRYAASRTSYNAMGQKVKVEKGELSDWQPNRVPPNAWPGFTILETQDFAYDVMGRLVRTRGLGSDGQVASVADTNYDRAGRPACTAERMNPAVFAFLPANACFLGTTGAQGADRIARNHYDPAGQLTKVQKAYGSPLVQDYATYTYSLNGKQVSVTDANGNRAELIYEGHDRQSHWIFPSKVTPWQPDYSNFEYYTYDANGNRVTLRKRDGTTLGYVYDGLNRVTLKTVPASVSGAAAYNVYYGYDLRGLQTFARFGSPTGAGVTNVFDGFGRLLSATTEMDGTARTISSQYDSNGNRVQLTATPGYSLTYAYDAVDRLASVAESGGSIALQFGYDSAGRRSSLGSGLGASSSAAYGYDSAGRLNALTHDLAGASADQGLGFGYNSAGQIVTRTRSNDIYASNTAYNVSRGYSVNGLNQYTAAGPATFQYDANANLTAQTSPEGSTAYVYDAENRLVSASGAQNATLSYDPMGRLWQVSSPANGTTRFEYDGDRLLREYDGAGALLRSYAHGEGADEPLIVYEPGGIRRFLHSDHQGSIVALADSSGNPVAVNAYDAWGIPNTAPQARFGYTGQTWLAELGLYYYKARIYSPTLGRFLQTDPIGYKDNINLYAYVGNDPINTKDPSGQSCVRAGDMVHCRHPDPSVPRVSFPAPSGWSAEISPQASGVSYHNYHIRIDAGRGGAETARSRLSEATRNPTPGSGDRPATPGGTRNDAGWIGLEWNNPVTSYTYRSGGHDTILNVTLPGHELSDGYIVQWFTHDKQGRVTMHVAGEGDAFRQGNWNGLARDFEQNTWGVQAAQYRLRAPNW